jgi:hypothetical protein
MRWGTLIGITGGLGAMAFAERNDRGIAVFGIPQSFAGRDRVQLEPILTEFFQAPKLRPVARGQFPVLRHAFPRLAHSRELVPRRRPQLPASFNRSKLSRRQRGQIIKATASGHQLDGFVQLNCFTISNASSRQPVITPDRQCELSGYSIWVPAGLRGIFLSFSGADG